MNFSISCLPTSYSLNTIDSTSLRIVFLKLSLVIPSGTMLLGIGSYSLLVWDSTKESTVGFISSLILASNLCCLGVDIGFLPIRFATSSFSFISCCNDVMSSSTWVVCSGVSFLAAAIASSCSGATTVSFAIISSPLAVNSGATSNWPLAMRLSLADNPLPSILLT